MSQLLSDGACPAAYRKTKEQNASTLAWCRDPMIIKGCAWSLVVRHSDASGSSEYYCALFSSERYANDAMVFAFGATLLWACQDLRPGLPGRQIGQGR